MVESSEAPLLLKAAVKGKRGYDRVNGAFFGGPAHSRDKKFGSRSLCCKDF